MTLEGAFNYRLEELFKAIAHAVVTTQQKLDGGLSLDYLAGCALSEHRMIFTIPRTSVQLRFGVVEKSSGGWRLVPWKKNLNREQMHTHELEFFVDAVTDPPPGLTAPEAGGSPVPLYMSTPYFMLTPVEEKEIADRLLADLNPNTRSWISTIPGPVKNIEALVLSELAAFEHALGDNNSEVGPVFFRYESTPASYLAVRVVRRVFGSDANDSVFVVTPGASPEVVIHSLEGDSVKSIRYPPLHHLLQTIRRWQDGTLLPTRTPINSLQGEPEVDQSDNGLASLLPFAADLRAGYADGLTYLSTAESFMEVAGAQVNPSVYYDLTGVRAALTYSLGFKTQGSLPTPQFDFVNRRTLDDHPLPTDDDPSETKLIESRALIRAFRGVAAPQVEIELEAPEFVLSGAARKRFLTLAVNSGDEIEKAFDPEDLLYRDFIETESYHQGVIALLSYRGDPKEEFLAIWPGAYLDQSRDFAFTCAVNNSDRSRLTNVKAVMRVKDDLDSVTFINADSDNENDEATGEQYRAFHNFFHAVRIWRARMMAGGAEG